MATLRRIVRLIPGAAALAFLAAGVWLFWGTHRWASYLRQESLREVARIPIDVSQPGEFALPLGNVQNALHGVELGIEVPPGFPTPERAAATAAGLALSVQVTDTEGRVLREEDLPPEMVSGVPGDEFHWRTRPGVFVVSLLLRGLDPTSERARMRVVSGAPGLAGRHQELVARQLLCGMGMLGLWLGRGLGVGCVLLSAGAGLGFRALRRRANPPHRHG